MKDKCIQTKLIVSNKLIESNEKQVYSKKANWFIYSWLNQLKSKCIQTKLIDSNKAYWNKLKQVPSNEANWFK